ncbi:MAG: sensor domain-containing diguanylate cyclase [Candidatus Omnitrophota bacterium]
MIIPAHIIPALILAYLFLIYYLFKRYLYCLRSLDLKRENLKGEINTLSAEIRNQNDIQVSLEQKFAHYNNLRSIANKIQDLSLQQICQHLVDYAFVLLGKEKSICSLYLVESDRQKLNLFLSRKSDRDSVLKQKQGDVFDRWVIRHFSSLLVNDTKTDFRFDLEKTEHKPERPVLSLISAPLKVEQKFLGILRLDKDEAGFYSQDDLRFLDTICNVGALGVENALLFQHTQELAIKDSLTAAYTKGYYSEYLNNEIERAKHNRKNLSVLMIDIDNFKTYNDRHGHIAGDILLKGLGSLLLGFFDKIPGALVCRFGGEEFSVLLPNLAKAKAHRLSEDLRLIIQEQKFFLRREETHVAVSIGLAGLSSDIAGASDLIFKADAALYNAKRKGKNQVNIG